MPASKVKTYFIYDSICYIFFPNCYENVHMWHKKNIFISPEVLCNRLVCMKFYTVSHTSDHDFEGFTCMCKEYKFIRDFFHTVMI